MSDEHNIFISHRHEDDALVARLKHQLERRGAAVRDSSVTSATPNNAHAPDYIRQLLAGRIRWAGKIIVLVTPDTRNHSWVDWEIEYAKRYSDKRIIGVWAPDATGCELPEPLQRHADAVVSWDADAIVRALNGEDNWQAPDGSEVPPHKIARASC